MTKLKNIFIYPAVGALFVACSDSVDISPVNLTLAIDAPEGIEASVITGGAFTMSNISTGEVTSFVADASGSAQAAAIPGFYNIAFVGTVMLPNGAEATVRGSRAGVDISSAASFCIGTYATATSADLIIKEIFFTGTLRSSGNGYVGDQYIKLCNNTSATVYADGLAIVESLFNTTRKNVYTPDIMSTDFTADAIYLIPGSGTDYPVEPGGELLIADIAIDHRVANPLSIDLSHADFEWYDQSSTPSTVDIDNPDVTNLDKWYCYTRSIWQLHNRGFKAYALARIPLDKEIFLASNYYTMDYEQVTVAGTFPMTASAYRIPNDWIVDAVNLSVESSFQWIVTAPALDSGWAYCGTLVNDKTRYFRAVRRRVAATDGTRIVFADTNNSSVDFNSNVTPSETELQGGAISADGTKASAVTLDGVLPAQEL